MFCVGIPAQESQYEQMKAMLNENSLPLVNMIVDVSSLNKSKYVSGEIEISDWLRRTDPNADVVKFCCKYRIRGGTASWYDKKSFAVKLYNENEEDLDANIFGIREENSWILDAMAIDRIRMRNRICFDVWNEMSQTPYETKYENRNGTKGVFVEVFINGNYNGLYCMTDKIDRKLLGLKKAKLNEEGDVTVKGILYKGVNWKSGHNLLSYEEGDTSMKTWNSWELQYPDNYPSADTWQPLMDLIDFCSDSTSDDIFIKEYQNFFYLENLVDYAVFTMAMNVGDNCYKNTFLSVVDITKEHRYMLSPWDMDMSLGGNYDGNYNEDVSHTDRYDQIAPFNRLNVQNIDGFKDSEISRWTKYHNTLFSPQSISDRLDNYAKLFTSSGAWEREYAKWNGNPVPLKHDIVDELTYVKEWYVRNHDNLCVQFGTDKVDGSGEINNEMIKGKNEGTVYDLTGCRINSPLKKGIYVINGKKVVVR
jgi:hypothetical protein